MASLHLKNGYIGLRWREGDTNRSVSLKPLKDNPKDWKIAEQIKLDKEAELRLGWKQSIVPTKKSITVQEAFRLYKSNNRLSDKTVEAYTIAIDRLTDYNSSITVDKLDRTFMDGYIAYLREQPQKIHADKKLSETTIFSYIRPLRTVVRYLVDTGRLDKNPIPSNKILKIKDAVKTSVEIPSDEMDQIELYLKGKSLAQYRYIRFLRLTAMRKEDARLMTWEKVFWKQGYINHVIGKTDIHQQLPLYDELREFLETWRQPKGRLFPEYNSRDSLKFWGRTLKSLGLPHYTLHDIRKTTLTELVYRGFDFETIHVFSGHTSPGVTWKHYIKKRNLMKAMKLANK